MKLCNVYERPFPTAKRAAAAIPAASAFSAESLGSFCVDISGVASVAFGPLTFDLDEEVGSFCVHLAINVCSIRRKYVPPSKVNGAVITDAKSPSGSNGVFGSYRCDLPKTPASNFESIDCDGSV